jgi:hypothetical protein
MDYYLSDVCPGRLHFFLLISLINKKVIFNYKKMKENVKYDTVVYTCYMAG